MIKMPSLALSILLYLSQSLISTVVAEQSLISTAPIDAKVYFITPSDGDVISGDVLIKFGLSGMGVAPAGLNKQNTGHHHLLINLPELPDLTKSLPASEQVVHFGGGQTETTITLPAGEHNLQLLLGNYLHIPHNPPVLSEPITITVE